MKHEYRIIEEFKPADFSKSVTKALADGWELWGNPAVTVAHGLTLAMNQFYQVVVRTAPSKPSDVGKLETGSTATPLGFTIQVPETPVKTEILNTTEKIVTNVKQLFSGILCCCYEREGDNPECFVHNTAPVRSGLVS